MFEVGQILVSTTHYGCTRSEFFEVIKTTKCTVTVRELRKRYDSDRYGQEGFEYPIKGVYVGLPMTKRVNNGRIKISSWASAGLWDGQGCWFNSD